MRKPPTIILGSPCRRCGGTERYRDRGCVRCKLEQSSARRIASAKERKASGTSQTYRGRKCPRGHRLRFRSNGKCVACDRAAYRRANKHRTPQAEVAKRARTPNRKRAMAKGARFYRGSPCLRGHDGLRFTQDGTCVECSRTYRARAPRAVKERALKRQRERDRRACRALRVLQDSGYRCEG
jgi:hypothetical protein